MGMHRLLLVVFICTQSRCNAIKKSLEMVHLVYRHGARSALSTYPNDKYQIKDWPDGAGRLTQIGMKLEYNLGKFLKARYIVNNSFIGPPYIHTQVYIQSSDVDRCLESAEVQLAGFYPPKGYQIWNTQIPWQPIPVHTLPKNKDPLLRPDGDYCPRREGLLKEKKDDPVYKYKLAHSETLLSKLSNYTGMDINFDNLGFITDAIICEKTQGWKQPKWVNDLWGEMTKISSWIFLNRFRGDDELGRILGGPLLGKINNNMEEYIKNKSKSSLPKMNMFSGHDTSLLSLASGLGINISMPIYASCIMIELHSSKAGYVVEIYFRKDYSGNLYPLKLKDCKFSCPLGEFIKSTSKRVTIDRDKECGIETAPGFFSMYRLKVLLVTCFALSIFFLIILIVVFCRRKSALIKQLFYQDEIGDTRENERLI